MKTHLLRRVFVWELPVRIYHWLNALAILVLIGTGLLIGNPLALKSGGEAYSSFWFGTVRFIHFTAAYIFFFNFIFRLYWGLVGNKYADWRNFIPTTKKYFTEMWEVIKIDIFLKKDKEHMSVGHNPLAGFIYFLTFLAFMLQVLTGFGLYAAMSDSFIANAFAWVPFVFGGDFFLRQIHHVTTWFFILFAIVHVYLVFYHDYVEGRGEISSMGGGWKFIEEEAFHAEKAAEKAAGKS
jgi:Ni/Fe-hydrogenase 1 B-type cytochrome subunit